MFQYKDAISICYGRQAIINLSSRMPTNQMLTIAKVIIEILMSIVKQRVFNQSHDY